MKEQPTELQLLASFVRAFKDHRLAVRSGTEQEVREAAARTYEAVEKLELLEMLRKHKQEGGQC